MKNRISFVFLFITVIIISISCTVSKRITSIQTAPSDSALYLLANSDELIDKYSKYDGVYLKIKDTYEHSATKTNSLLSRNGEWMYHRINSVKYLVINPDKQELTTFSIKLPPKTKFNSYYLVTLSPDKQIKRYDRTNLITEKDYNGMITYKFAIPDIRKGTTVEYGLDLSFYGGPLEYDIPLQYTMPCEKLELKFAYPDWWEVRTKKISDSVNVGYKVNENIEEKKKIISYEAENIPPITSEPFAPFFNEVAKYLRINFTLIDLSYPIKFFKGWNEIAHDYKNYAMNKEGFLSNKAGGKSDDLTEGLTDPVSKLDTIVSFIQKEISIADDGTNRNFGKILKDKKGSIYEICGLTEAMLSEAELETDYLLIHSARNGIVDYDFISYDQFQLPAVRTKIDSVYYVVIPYSKFLPIDYLPEFVQEQPALIVSNNEAKHGQFWKTPVGKMTNNDLVEDYNINISSDGLLNVNEMKIANGLFAYDLREYFDKKTEKEIEQEIPDMLTYTEGNIDILNYEIINKENYKEPLKIKIEYNINNLITITPDEILFQTAGLLSPSSKFKKRLDPKERINPIVIYFDQIYTKNIKINYPREWNVVQKIDNVKFSNEFGQIEGNYNYSDGLISIDQKSYLLKNKQPKEKIEELLKITGNISKLQVPVIIFTR